MNSPAPTQHSPDGNYRVVALKYRPQTFEALIGQGHIATALSNAIIQSRVGHAYLFTGARGVGKTSSARIFAKCLNCVAGPTTTPCGKCDVCETVSTGEDVDVLEIDGASNRGIDEIRSLRSNAAIRPSRARYKIYIIDEVHMLTMQAFNALLKTLEEPPAHVKFIFCTTDPQKIPITVLSRCQRYDFSPVQTHEIAHSLRQIAEQEGVQADEQALALLARRANGSMRDSQSLLEQLFSFCDSEITVAHVHQLLGTADIGRIGEMAAAMVAHDSTTTLNLIQQACNDGVSAGQLAEQLLGYFRDAMAVKVNCGLDALLTCTQSELPALTTIGGQIGLETILSIVQLLDSAIVKMQSSLHARTLVEVAAIRICNLENLESISDLVRQLSAASATGAAVTRSHAPATPRSVELQKITPSPALKKNEIAETSASIDSTHVPKPTAQAAPTIPASHLNTARPVAQPSSTISKIAPDRPLRVALSSADRVSPTGPSVLPLSAASAGREVSTLAVVTTDQISGPARDSTTAHVSGEVAANTADLRELWVQMLTSLGDMTSELAASYEALGWESDNCVGVSLYDEYHVRECRKPERKQKIESALSKITGRKIVVEFRVAKNGKSLAADQVPQLSRARQMRMLQDVDFVKQTMSIFDAEVVGFFALPRKLTK